MAAVPAPDAVLIDSTGLTIEEVVVVPASVAGGTYDLRVALVDPGLDEDNPNRRFRLVNSELDDGSARYTVGRVTILNEPTPTALPVATPLPTEVETTSPSGESWLSRLLSTIYDWLRTLIAGLR